MALIQPLTIFIRFLLVPVLIRIITFLVNLHFLSSRNLGRHRNLQYPLLPDSTTKTLESSHAPKWKRSKSHRYPESFATTQIISSWYPKTPSFYRAPIWLHATRFQKWIWRNGGLFKLNNIAQVTLFSENILPLLIPFFLIRILVIPWFPLLQKCMYVQICHSTPNCFECLKKTLSFSSPQLATSAATPLKITGFFLFLWKLFLSICSFFYVTPVFCLVIYFVWNLLPNKWNFNFLFISKYILVFFGTFELSKGP